MQTFGDNFAANMAGSSATISGNNPPIINQMIATQGPEKFMDIIPNIIDPLDLRGSGSDRKAPTRFNNFLDRLGIGVLGLALITAGILYLGFVAYRSAPAGKIANAAKSAIGG